MTPQDTLIKSWYGVIAHLGLMRMVCECVKSEYARGVCTMVQDVEDRLMQDYDAVVGVLNDISSEGDEDED